MGVFGINIVATNAITYGVLISSTHVQPSSVNAGRGRKIATAANMSSWTTVSYTSVTVGGAVTYGFLQGVTMVTLSYSSAAANGSAGVHLPAPPPTITQSYITSQAGFGASLLHNSTTTQSVRAR